jgi:acyl dehydratase
MRAPGPPAVASSWWFDDAEVGTTIHHRGGRTIGRDEHVLLAWITNNASDVHGNADAAARTEFGQAIVLGALTVAIVIGLAEPAEWPPAELARYRPLGWRSIRLTGLVLPGDTLRAESVILGAEPFADRRGGLVRRVIVGRTQAGTEVVRVEEERAVPTWAPHRTKDC